MPLPLGLEIMRAEGTVCAPRAPPCPRFRPDAHSLLAQATLVTKDKPVSAADHRDSRAQVTLGSAPVKSPGGGSQRQCSPSHHLPTKLPSTEDPLCCPVPSSPAPSPGNASSSLPVNVLPGCAGGRGIGKPAADPDSAHASQTGVHTCPQGLTARQRRRNRPEGCRCAGVQGLEAPSYQTHIP